MKAAAERSFADHLSRVESMATDKDGATWDLSENDLAALNAVLRSRAALEAACRKFVRKVECGEAHSRHSYAEMVAALAVG